MAGVAEALHGLCAAAEVRASSCASIAIAYPSIFTPRERRMLGEWGKFPGGEHFDFAGWASSQLGLPLAIENDARVALLGEWRYGAGRGCDDLVMMTLGTGLGTAALQGGRLLVGHQGRAGSAGGHFTLVLDGRPCVCGNVGCAEAEASTSTLGTLARTDSRFAASALAQLPEIGYEAAFRLRDRDALSRALVERSLKVWSAAVLNLVQAYDPSRVVLGGGVMASAGVILPAVRGHLDRHGRGPWRTPDVVASALGDDAALLGCGVLAELRSELHVS